MPTNNNDPLSYYDRLLAEGGDQAASPEGGVAADSSAVDDFKRAAGDLWSGIVDQSAAAGASLIEGATLGGGDRLHDRATQGYDTGHPFTDQIAGQMVRAFPTLLPAVDAVTGHQGVSGPAQEATEEAQSGHPVTSFLGEVVGGLGFGGLASAGARHGAKEAVETASPFVTRWIQRLAGKPGGRVTTGAGAGAAEGSMFAANQGENPATGALYGAGGGAAGQAVLGEGIPLVARTISNSDLPKQAADISMNEAREARGVGQGTGRDMDDAAIVRRRQELGDQATLMDAEPGFANVGEGMMASGAGRRNAPDIAFRFNPRSPRSAELEPEFEQAVLGALSRNTFNTRTQSGNVSTARTRSQLAEDARNNRRALQPEWDAVLDNSPRRFTFNEVMNTISDNVDFRESTTAVSKAEKRLRQTLERLSQDSRARALEGGATPPAGDLSPRALHVMRRELDEQANKAIRAGNGTLAGNLLDARRSISDMLTDEVPGFASINARYSNEFSYQRAYDAAYDGLFSNKTDDFALELAKRNSSPADLPGFVEGATAAVLDKLAISNNAADARKLLKNDKTQAKLKQLFGDDIAKELTRASDQLITFKDTHARLSGGSRTEFREAMAKKLESLVRRGIILGGLSRIVGGDRYVAALPSSGSTYGALGREARMFGKSAEDATFPIMDNWLSQTGPDADAALAEMRGLHDIWFPTTRLAGLGFNPRMEDLNLVQQAMRTDIGNSPAQVAGVQAASGTGQREQDAREQALIEQYLGAAQGEGGR